MSDTFLTNCLANIEVVNEELTISAIPIVRHFEKIFKDISGLPLKGEIYLCVNLVSGNLPISKPLYRMVPTKILELNKQVQELQDLGFVHPSTSL